MIKDENIPGTFRVMEEEHNTLQRTFLFIQSKLDALVPGKLKLNQSEELIFLLSYFQKRLAFHFNIEETLGILHDIKQQEPHLKAEVDAIVEDHALLLQRLAEVLKFAQGNSLQDEQTIDSVVGMFTAFLNHLKAHEDKESSLLLKAVPTDEE